MSSIYVNTQCESVTGDTNVHIQLSGNVSQFKFCRALYSGLQNRSMEIINYFFDTDMVIFSIGMTVVDNNRLSEKFSESFLVDLVKAIIARGTCAGTVHCMLHVMYH